MKELAVIIGFLAWLTTTITMIATIIGVVPLVLFFDEWFSLAVMLLNKL